MSRSTPPSTKQVTSGVYPCDPSKTSKLLATEGTNVEDLKEKRIIKAASDLTRKHLEEFENLVKRKHKRVETTRAAKKRARKRFSTASARVLTSSKSIARLKLTTSLSKVYTLKVEELRQYMLNEMQLTPAQLHKDAPQTSRWKKKEELIAMVEEFYDNKWQALAGNKK